MTAIIRKWKSELVLMRLIILMKQYSVLMQKIVLSLFEIYQFLW